VLTWSPPASGGAPSAYIIEAGSQPGLANLANFSTGTTATSFTTGGVGNGTYFVRVRATNAAGTSVASNEATLVVGGGACTAAPPAPTGFAPTFNSGGTVSFAWNPSAGATTYVIEAGSTTGSNNIVPGSDLGGTATTFTATGVGAGTYFVRLRARNACGTSSASNEVALTVR
jgi:predicted phage tail protein